MSELEELECCLRFAFFWCLFVGFWWALVGCWDVYGRFCKWESKRFSSLVFLDSFCSSVCNDFCLLSKSHKNVCMAVVGLCNEVEFCLKLGIGYFGCLFGSQRVSIFEGHLPILNLKLYSIWALHDCWFCNLIVFGLDVVIRFMVCIWNVTFG